MTTSFLLYIFGLLGLTTFTTRDNLWSLFILIIGFYISVIGIIHNVEKLFSESSLGQMAVLSGLSLLGILCMVFTMVTGLMWQVKVV